MEMYIRIIYFVILSFYEFSLLQQCCKPAKKESEIKLRQTRDLHIRNPKIIDPITAIISGSKIKSTSRIRSTERYMFGAFSLLQRLILNTVLIT